MVINSKTMNIYYVMTCYHLTGDSTVKFYASEAQMRRAYEAIVRPIVCVIKNNELEDLEGETWYSIEDTNIPATFGGFRVNGGENEILDELVTPEGVNVYYQWGIAEVPLAKVGIELVTPDDIRYFASFSEYVDESTIQFCHVFDAQSFYNNTITEHFDLASTRNNFHIDRNDKDTWFSDDDDNFGRELFNENDDKTDAYFGYCDVTETIRYGRIEMEPTIVLDGTGSMSTAAYDAMHTPDFGKRGEMKIYIANNPDMDSLAVLMSDPILGVFYDEDKAIKAVTDAMTEDWWNQQDREPFDFVTTHIVE